MVIAERWQGGCARRGAGLDGGSGGESGVRFAVIEALWGGDGRYGVLGGARMFSFSGGHDWVLTTQLWPCGLLSVCTVHTYGGVV